MTNKLDKALKILERCLERVERIETRLRERDEFTKELSDMDIYEPLIWNPIIMPYDTLDAPKRVPYRP